MAGDGDEDVRRDDELILQLAEASGGTHWHKPEGTLYRIGDSETQFAIAHRSGRWLADRTDRGHTVEVAEFSDGATARAWLVAQMTPSVRSRRGWPPIFLRDLQPGARFESGPHGSRLEWDGGWAVFRSTDDFDARYLSWVVALGIPEYVASFQGHVRPAALPSRSSRAARMATAATGAGLGVDAGQARPSPWLAPHRPRDGGADPRRGHAGPPGHRRGGR